MLQTTVIDMEWNTKWDWENIDVFGSKGVESPKKLQPREWGITVGEDISESFNLSGVVGGSASDVGNNSSAKSSMSASTESSFKDGIRASNISFEGCGGFPDAYSKKKEFPGCELNGTSPSLEASVCSSEQSIGLKLGKRTYFENGFTRSNTKIPSPKFPNSSASTMKKVKLSSQSTSITRCQVEGCNLDLSSAKEYHRKHKVCESHSKSLKVVVGGLERRFCQQCSRFHGLSEFDGKKRSCRRRLSDHNSRRRKPQQETIHFNSRSLSSSVYDGQHQLSFVFNNVPVSQTNTSASSIWVSTSNSERSVPTTKAEKHGGDNGLSHSLGIQFPEAQSMPTLAFNRIMPSNGTTAGIFYQGSNAEALDLCRALSLLSNSSWGSCEPDFSPLDHPVHIDSPSMRHNVMPSASLGLPGPSPDYWQADDQSINPNTHATHFQASHILSAPFGIQYVGPMDEILKPL